MHYQIEILNSDFETVEEMRCAFTGRAVHITANGSEEVPETLDEFIRRVGALAEHTLFDHPGCTALIYDHMGNAIATADDGEE